MPTAPPRRTRLSLSALPRHRRSPRRSVARPASRAPRAAPRARSADRSASSITPPPSRPSSACASRRPASGPSTWTCSVEAQPTDFTNKITTTSPGAPRPASPGSGAPSGTSWARACGSTSTDPDRPRPGLQPQGLLPPGPGRLPLAGQAARPPLRGHPHHLLQQAPAPERRPGPAHQGLDGGAVHRGRPPGHQRHRRDGNVDQAPWATGPPSTSPRCSSAGATGTRASPRILDTPESNAGLEWLYDIQYAYARSTPRRRCCRAPTSTTRWAPGSWPSTPPGASACPSCATWPTWTGTWWSTPPGPRGTSPPSSPARATP